MKILVSGLINQETNVNVHSFPVGYEPIVYAFDEVKVNLSGVAFNIAGALHVLGAEVLPASIIGNDSIGVQITTAVKQMGLKTDFLRKELNESCTSVILFDDSGRRKVFCDLKNIQDKIYPVQLLNDEIKSCDALVICNINFNDELIRNAKQYGKTVFTDVHVLKDIEDNYNRRFLENADVVFLSDEGIKCRYEDFLINLYKKYHNRIIVLGMGSKGAMLLDSKEKAVYFIESVYTRPVVNTVGAGDSLFSAFVFCYMQNNDSLMSLKKAVTFASYKIGESGGAEGFMNSDKLNDFYNKIEYKVYKTESF